MLRTQPRLRSKDHALEVIERNATSQLRLVEDLLDMARVISGKLRLEIATVSLRDVVAAALDVVAPAAAARRITTSLTVDDDVPPVSGDFDRLQQVVWNLLSNAVKFTDTGGAIDVHICRSSDGADVVVRDSGQGIHAEFLPFVFDRFRQADSSPSRRHGGLGLGLALVRQIVELHGGTATAASHGQGRGSTFTIHLPAAATGARLAPRLVADAGEVTLAGVGVLVVDDNADSRELLSTALRDYGAQVEAVESTSAAMTLLHEAPVRPEILVSDIGMPGSDGFELIRRLRADPATKDLPAIAVTAYANPEDRIRALVAGYQTHIPKPVDLNVLAVAVAALVPRRPRPTTQPV
jgi:CheY-like chemotaxis protein